MARGTAGDKGSGVEAAVKKDGTVFITDGLAGIRSRFNGKARAKETFLLPRYTSLQLEPLGRATWTVSTLFTHTCNQSLIRTVKTTTYPHGSFFSPRPNGTMTLFEKVKLSESFESSLIVEKLR